MLLTRDESEREQVVPEVRVLVAGASQAASLQLGHQPVTDLHDVAPTEVAVHDKKSVAADLLHELVHDRGYLFRRTDKRVRPEPLGTGEEVAQHLALEARGH